MSSKKSNHIWRKLLHNWTQLSGMISLPTSTQNHSVHIGLFCSGFVFMNILTDNFLMHFCIIKTGRCVWVNYILYQYFFFSFFFFALFVTNFSFENILYYVSLHSTEKLENINRRWLSKLEKWNNRHLVCQFLKFMLGCRLSFEAYARIVREKATTYTT